MASLLDRLLGRTEPEAKAVTGPGAFAMTYHTPYGASWTTSASRDPHRLMAEALALYRQPWVNVAERAISNRLLRLPWHLEDEAGDTVDESAGEQFQVIQRLIERPNPQMTRRQLWGVTLRHLGLAGNAFWYLDQRDLAAGTPLQILYINPARMTPAQDDAGNVTGWVVDHPDNSVTGSSSGQGIPLDASEVIHFKLDEPDFGVWGLGLAEAAQRKVDLSRITDGYIGQVLGTGGRITGILAPKDGTSVFTEDEFKQYANDWRRIVDDPNAAKRLQLSKKPVELVQTSMSPRDLLLPDVAKMSRDDVLGVWGVPLSQVGIPVPAGLNSGERGSYDEAALHEGAVQPRGEALREPLQYQLLDRFAGLGTVVNLVIDYPEFDDKEPLFKAADLAKVIPYTNDERRNLVGLEPLEDAELGAQVWIASTMTRMNVEDPEPVVPLLPPSGATPTDDDEEEVVEEVVGKASLREGWEPKFRGAIAKVLEAQKSYVLSKSDHALRKNDTGWWSEKREHARFMDALAPLIESLALQTSRAVKPAGKADLSLPQILAFVRERVGERVKGINATTRDKIQAAVKTAVSEGLSPADLGKLIEDSAAFNAARAETIARTETAMAYNDSAIQTYRSYDVSEVQVIDGDGDAECAHADGATWSIDDALNDPLGHPNCTRDFIPVVKAVIEPNPMLVMAEAVKASLDRPWPNPVVNVTTPDVSVYPQFHFPEQTPAQVTVNLPEPKPTTKRVIRDENGVITGIEETE
jgi:phage portal protein BeeE